MGPPHFSRSGLFIREGTPVFAGFDGDLLGCFQVPNSLAQSICWLEATRRLSLLDDEVTIEGKEVLNWINQAGLALSKSILTGCQLDNGVDEEVLTIRGYL